MRCPVIVNVSKQSGPLAKVVLPRSLAIIDFNDGAGDALGGR
jgi:hypothetical protein